MKIDVKADIQKSVTFLKNAKSSLSSFKEFLNRNATQALAERTRRIFDSRGFGSWGKASLIKTGRLFRSYTQPNSSENIAEVTKGSLRFGSSVPYARYHEEGRGTPQREVIGAINRQSLTNDLSIRLATDIDEKLEKI